MNSVFGDAIPDPLEVVEHSILQPPWEEDMCLDPFARMLGEFETSVEQPIPPEQEIFADPICDALSCVEASTESQQFTAKFFLPDVMLDRLEASIEQQRPKPTLIDEDPPPMEGGGIVPQDEACGPPVGGAWGEGFSMPRGQPTYRMHRGTTGLRDGGGLSWYCYLRERPVSAEECDICPDFENSDSVEDDGEERCRHSVS